MRHLFTVSVPVTACGLFTMVELAACGITWRDEEPPSPQTAADTGDAPGGSSTPGGALAGGSETDPMDAAYPLHGLVTGLQLHIRRRPNPNADVIGWLRIGSRVRAKRRAATTEHCASGWHRIYPRGFVCAGQGLQFGGEPPEADTVIAPPDRSAALPYQYWFVKEEMTPEYHRPPPRPSQRSAEAFANRYLSLLEDDESRAERFLAGELANEPAKPPVVHRYLDRGFYVASNGSVVRASRRFVQTVRGRYVKQARLIERTGPEFRGVELDEQTTPPIVWAVRTAHYRIRRDRDDGIRYVKDMELEPIPRHTQVLNWLRRENIEGKLIHVLETEHGERYIRDWFLAVAEHIERPRGVKASEPWVHINLDQQTLVLYRGDQPLFATLVSTGQEGFETPEGLFAIHRKYIADTMANVGDGNDDRYSIEDVPWAQYFSGSVALHGAFWHSRFGLQRSHGCVNLAPADARRVFSALWPQVPEGWLGVSVGAGHGFKTSHVYVTQS